LQNKENIKILETNSKSLWNPLKAIHSIKHFYVYSLNFIYLNYSKSVLS